MLGGREGAVGGVRHEHAGQRRRRPGGLPDGDVAYAFKSVEGESDMMGTPKGFATAREVMMSKLCDDLKAEISILGAKGVQCSEVQEAPWGSVSRIQPPGGGEVGLALLAWDDEWHRHAVILEHGLANFTQRPLAHAKDVVDALCLQCRDGGGTDHASVGDHTGTMDAEAAAQALDHRQQATDGYRPEAKKPISPELVQQFRRSRRRS
jgi:hypothetical protein